VDFISLAKSTEEILALIARSFNIFLSISSNFTSSVCLDQLTPIDGLSRKYPLENTSTSTCATISYVKIYFPNLELNSLTIL